MKTHRLPSSSLRSSNPIQIRVMEIFLAWLLFLGQAANLTTAQSQTSQTNEPPQVSVTLNPEWSAAEISLQQINDRIKELESTTDIDQAAKSQLIEIYRQVSQRLETTKAHQENSRSFQSAIENGPRRTAEGRELIQKLPPLDQIKLAPELEQTSAADTLQTRITQGKATLAIDRSRLEALQRRLSEEESRPQKAQTQLSEAKSILTSIQQELKTVAPANDGPEVDRAKSLLLLAREQFRLSEIAMLQLELLSHPLRLELTKVEIELLTQQIRIAETRLQLVEKKISALRTAEAEASRLQAEKLKRESIGKHPLVRFFSEELATLATEIETQTAKIAETQGHRQLALKTSEQLRADREEVDRTLEIGEINETLARVLLELRRSLPTRRKLDQDLKTISEKRAQARLRIFNIERELRQVGDANEFASALIEIEQDDSEALSERDEVVAELTRVVQLKIEQLEKLRALIEANLVEINQLELLQRDLSKESSDLLRILDENLLWIPNAAPLSPEVLKANFHDTIALFKKLDFPALSQFMMTDMAEESFPYCLFGATFLGLFVFRKRAIDHLESNSKSVGKVHLDSIGLTTQAGMATVLLSAPLALLLGFLGWRLGYHPNNFLNSLSPALKATAILFLALRILRASCRPKGLGEIHFRWPAEDLKIVRYQLAWFLPLASFVFIILIYTESLAEPSYRRSVGRLAFSAIFILTAILSQTLLHPKRGIATKNKSGQTWISRSRFMWHSIGGIVSLTLVFLAFYGYYYMALALGHRLYESILLVLASLFAFAFLQRWTIVSQRKLAYKIALERRQALAKEVSTEPGTKKEMETPEIQEEIDLAEVKTQTLDLIKMSIGLLLALGLWFTWSDTFPALTILDSFDLWPHTVIIDGTEQFRFITLADLLLAILAVIVTIFAARNMPGFLEIFVLQRLPVDQGTRYAIRTLSLYVIVTSGTILALQTIGMSWGSVQWLVAALTVGLGFGLQEIFGNFVSGLIILLERPIRVGDTVTVGTISGVVTQIKMRATTITDWNRKELIVPNKSFITGELVNWSLSDPILRLDFVVGIAYGSDTTLAHQTMTTVCREHPLVLKHPEATVFFVGFGESSLNFEARVFVAEATNTARTRITHDLHLAIDRAFREKGISISFPQRDVHLDMPKPLEIIVSKGRRNDS